MAIHLDTGGNASIVFGGQWNPQFSDPNEFNWVNPLSGATALTLAVSVKPNNPFHSDPADFHIFHQNDSAFQLFKGTGGALVFRIFGPDIFQGTSVTTTSSVALVPGVWNRIMARWRAASNTFAIDVNGVNFPVSAGGSVANLCITPPGHSHNYAIELGADSAGDLGGLQADYAEAAIWAAYLPDADAVKYGQGYSPDLLTPTNRARYVKLDTLGTLFPDGINGSVTDVWSGVYYGFGQPVPWGGIFGGQVTPHPLVIYDDPGGGGAYVPHLIEDLPSLPSGGFTVYELTGGAGKRSTNPPHLVPSQKSLFSAMVQAEYGDDILLDPTVITTTGGINIPTGKTIDATTPRMPPSLQRDLITMSQPVTMS